MFCFMPSLPAQSLHHLIPLLAGLGTAVQLLVLAVLVLASIICWSLILRKAILFRRVRQQSTIFFDTLRSGHDLSFITVAARRLSYASPARVFLAVSEQLGVLRRQHRLRLDHVGSEALSLTHEHLRHLAQREQGGEIRRLEQGLSFLATTAGVAPFVGLLGTVWGIMQSFQAIGTRGGATLAVVGPGISEALVATAAGLAVAIPALIAYNFFLSRLRRMETELDSFAEEIALLFGSYLVEEMQRQESRPTLHRS
jgi:biopolymer transport protein TolQ